MVPKGGVVFACTLLFLFSNSSTLIFATTVDNHEQHKDIYNSDSDDTLLQEQHYYPTIADIEDISSLFKNSKVYQDSIRQAFESHNNNKQQRRRRRRTATTVPTTIDPAFIAYIGKKYFSNVDTGGVISIAYKNNPKYCEGFGYANKERKEPMTCNHLVQIASNSKAMASLLSLVASKKKAIDLDEPVRLNYPSFNPTSHSSGGNSADTLTVRDLLNHRTGMPRHDYLWQQPFSPRSGKMTRKQIIQTIPFLEMSRPQRIKAEYNNVMYTVAGVATANGLNILNQKQQEQQNKEADGIDKIWEDYMETEIFQPFEMNQGTYPTLGRVPQSEMSKFATPYNKDQKEIDPNTGSVRRVPSKTIMEKLNGDCVGPSMSVVSNGNDMYKYLYNLLHVLNPLSSSYTGTPKIDIEIQELINSQNIYSYDYDTGFGKGQTYSFGWSKSVFHNTKVFHHGGAMYGYSSFILLIPSLEFGIFAIDNKYQGALNVVLAVREIITTLFFNDVKSSELHQRMLIESSQLTNNLNKDHGNNNHIENFVYSGRNSRSRSRRKLFSSAASPISFKKYVGTYRHPAYGVYTIKLNTQQNGLLYSRPLSSDSNFYELEFVRDHIFKPKLRSNTSFKYGKWLYFVDDPSGKIMFFLSQLANAKSTGGNIAPIAFMKQGITNALTNKWLDQEFRKLPFQFPRDDL